MPCYYFQSTQHTSHDSNGYSRGPHSHSERLELPLINITFKLYMEDLKYIKIYSNTANVINIYTYVFFKIKI